MKIKGSGNKYYDVNIEELTCTCKDWTCRRHNFSKDNPRRLCKHLLQALELNELVTESNNTILTDKSAVHKLAESLYNSSSVLRYNIAKNCYNNLLPVIVKFIHPDVPNDEMDNILVDYKVDKLYSPDGSKRIYKGPQNLLVIIIKDDSFPFQSLYYRLGREKFIELSSTIMRKLGLKLTENGLLDKDNKLIDLNIHTEEEIYHLIDMSEPIE